MPSRPRTDENTLTALKRLLPNGSLFKHEDDRPGPYSRENEVRHFEHSTRSSIENSLRSTSIRREEHISRGVRVAIINEIPAPWIHPVSSGPSASRCPRPMKNCIFDELYGDVEFHDGYGVILTGV